MSGERDAAAVRVFPPGVPVTAILLGILLQQVWPVELDLGIEPPLRYWMGASSRRVRFWGSACGQLFCSGRPVRTRIHGSPRRRSSSEGPSPSPATRCIYR